MDADNKQTKSAPASTPSGSSSSVQATAFNTPVAIILAGLIIAGAVVFSSQSTGGTPTATGPTASTTQQQPAPAPTVDSSKIDVTGDPYLGQADAPVTMIFWSDYQCPFCKAVEVGGIAQIPTPPAFPDIIKNYVNPGKVKIVFKDYPFLGQDSITGALYGRAVWNLYPDKYFAWRTAMFTAQDEEGDKGFGDAASIDKLDATIPGLDAAKIAADVKANGASYTKEIAADKSLGLSSGVTGTPGAIIGTVSVDGAQPYSAFANAIDATLAATQQ